VKGKITLIKDYGVILSFTDDLTGFILNDNLLTSNHKEG